MGATFVAIVSPDVAEYCVNPVPRTAIGTNVGVSKQVKANWRQRIYVYEFPFSSFIFMVAINNDDYEQYWSRLWAKGLSCKPPKCKRK